MSSQAEAHSIEALEAANEHTEALKPLSDAMQLADGFRERQAVLADGYRKFKLNPDLPGPSRETYAKFEKTPR